MRKLYVTSFIYLIVGLFSGVFYREFAKFNDFDTTAEYTQLGTLHTHLLVLGFIVPLVFLALERGLRIAKQKPFWSGFWIYNVGVVWTLTMMTIRGVYQVMGTIIDSAAFSGIAGIGHILLAVALVMIMIAVGRAITVAEVTEARNEPVSQ